MGSMKELKEQITNTPTEHTKDTKPKTLKCQCCNQPATKLVRHRWWEKDGSTHSRQICMSCNRILAFGTHVLPNWKWQQDTVKGYRQLLNRQEQNSYHTLILDYTYTITAPDYDRARRTAAHLHKATHDTPYGIEYLTKLATAHKAPTTKLSK